MILTTAEYIWLDDAGPNCKFQPNTSIAIHTSYKAKKAHGSANYLMEYNKQSTSPATNIA